MLSLHSFHFNSLVNKTFKMWLSRQLTSQLKLTFFTLHSLAALEGYYSSKYRHFLYGCWILVLSVIVL